jgi:hypothetical protein
MNLSTCLRWALALTPFLAVYTNAHSQDSRVVQQELNSWYAGTLSATLAPSVKAVGQYHFRRTDLGSSWQQSLLFLGAEWTSPSKLTWSAAYGDIVNFPGGVASKEHRLFEQLVYARPMGSWTMTHRHRVEHRWLEEKDFDVRHRYRIDFIVTRPLNDRWVIRAHNESLIAAFDRTSNVIYQQNWLGLGLVHKFSPSSSLSLEYMNQFVFSQQGWAGTSNHTVNWMYSHDLDFSSQKSQGSQD